MIPLPITFRPQALKSLVLAGLLLFSSVAGLFGQAQSLTQPQLEAAAAQFEAAGDYVGGRPYFEELIRRLEGFNPVPPGLEGAMFYFALSFMQEYGRTGEVRVLDRAVAGFESYIKKFPEGPRVTFAYMNIADSYRGQAKWTEAADALEKLLNPPVSARVSPAMRAEALQKIVEALYIKKEWDRGIPWFRTQLRESRDRIHQADSAVALIEAYLSKGDVNAAIEYLPYLAIRAPARFTVRFNLELIKAGDELEKMKRYNDASLVFNLTLTVSKIKKYFEQRLISLRSRLAYVKSMESALYDKEIGQLEVDIFNAEQQIKVASEIEDYTPQLRLRIARLYVLTSRDWEGFWAYWELARSYPNDKQIETFVYSAFIQADKVEFGQKIEEMGELYLSRPEFELYVKPVSVILARHYSESKQYEKFFRISRQFVERYPGDPLSAQMVYFMGKSWTEQDKPEELLDVFAGLQYDEETPRSGGYIDQFPDAPMLDGLLYWSGLSSIFIGDLESAHAYFSRLIKEKPSSAYYEDAYYRNGITQFGLKQLDDARLTFEHHIKEYPESAVRGEAHFFLGQIYGQEKQPARALEHYYSVEKYTDIHRYIQDAYFEAGKLLRRQGESFRRQGFEREAIEQFRRMEQNYQDYINKYREVGLVASATYELGAAIELQGEPDRMLQVYLDAIRRFGNEPQRDGLDRVITAYAEKYEEHKEIIETNIAFLEKLINDDTFRQRIVALEVNAETKVSRRNKRFVFSYFMGKDEQGANMEEPFRVGLVESRIVRALQRDDNLAVRLLTDTTPVEEWLQVWRERYVRFPKETPDATLYPMWRDARDTGMKPLRFRLQRIIEEMRGIEIDNYAFTSEDFQYGSPAVIVWMADKIRARGNLEEMPQAQEGYRLVIRQWPESQAAIDSFMRLASFESDVYFKYDEAFTLYTQMMEHFPAADEAMDAAILRIEMLILAKNDPGMTQAIQRTVRLPADKTLRDYIIDELQTILKTPTYRGIQGQACFRLGEMLEEAGDTTQALAYYKRSFIVFKSSREWSAKAYLKGIQLMNSLGQREDAKTILEEFLAQADEYQNFDEYRQGLALRNTL